MGSKPPTIYSERLGAIADEQFAAAAIRLGLGVFVSAGPTRGGLFGQNLFLTTDAGEFVLRGAPHWPGGWDDPDYQRFGYRHQFTKESFFVNQVKEHTRAPAPWPYLHDESTDIFGWPYVIMPRMPGSVFNERTILKALRPHERNEVAVAAGSLLAELQKLTSSFSGDFDTRTIALTPDENGHQQVMVATMLASAAGADANGVMTPADMDWIAAVARDARSLGERPNTFVHGDYKLDNMTVVQTGGRWQIGGVFDFQTARFGDGAFDLVHQTCAYLDTEPALAQVFVDAYRNDSRSDGSIADWIPLCVLKNRVGLWNYFVRRDRSGWSSGKTFMGWAEPYIEQMIRLVC